jgi:uncharacterized protein (DUF362 family)
MQSRRNFIIRSLAAGTASLLAGNAFSHSLLRRSSEPREGIPNPYLDKDGKPILVIVEGENFDEMLAMGLETLGGLDKLVGGENNVFINPNLNGLDDYPAISDADAIAGLAAYVDQHTSGEVVVGDVGYDPTLNTVNALNLKNKVEQAGAELKMLKDTTTVQASGGGSYEVFSDIYNAPVLIDFCCLKRHFLGHMTGAIKNNVGTIKGEGAEYSRAKLHAKSGASFLSELAKIADLVKPDLAIMDARSLLVKNGPFTHPRSNGAEIRTGYNKLFISGDIVGLDTFAAHALQLEDETFNIDMISHTLNQARLLGLGVNSLDDITVIEVSATGTGEHVGKPGREEGITNYPNPFREETMISYSVKSAGKISIDVRDVNGRHIIGWVRRHNAPGSFEISFRTGDLAPGIYSCIMRTDLGTSSKLMIRQ